MRVTPSSDVRTSWSGVLSVLSLFSLEKFPKTLTIQTRFEIETTQWMHVIVLFMAWPREFRRSRHNSNIYQNNCDIWSSWSGRGMITQYEMFLTSSLTPPEIFYTFVVILLMLVVRYFLQHSIRFRSKKIAICGWFNVISICGGIKSLSKRRQQLHRTKATSSLVI